MDQPLVPPRSWRKHSYPNQTGVDPASRPRTDSAWTLAESNASSDESTKLPSVIRATKSASTPPKGRSIVICLDGTGDSFDNDNSNVVNFVACLKKDDPSQVTYYQSGIGTYDGSGLKNGCSAAVDMAVGSGLGIHIRDAYRFLMQNYREGDRICLLGFSRGAYTVRCFAGMLHKVGLLPAHNIAQIQFAYEFYKNDTQEGWNMSREFKRTFCTNVSVYFVGVWDCVAAVGFIPRKLPFSKSPTNSIAYFRHAMALDEHRAKFKVCQWQQQNLDAQGGKIDHTGHKHIDMAATKAKKITSKAPKPALIKTREQKEEEEELEAKQDLLDTAEDCPTSILKPKTDVKEIWTNFIDYADVGGGSELNVSRHMLSRIPLRWMIRQCFECETGIIFSTAALAETGLDVPSMWPIYRELNRPVVGPSPGVIECYEKGELPPIHRRSSALGVVDEKIKDLADRRRDHPHTANRIIAPRYNTDFELLPEHVEDHFDAMCNVNDMLKIAKGWWILEIWPVKVRLQTRECKTGEWVKKVRCNMGRYRAIREMEPAMHWTVQTRLEEWREKQDEKAEPRLSSRSRLRLGGYRLRNRLDKDAVWRVEC